MYAGCMTEYSAAHSHQQVEIKQGLEQLRMFIDIDMKMQHNHHIPRTFESQY